MDNIRQFYDDYLACCNERRFDDLSDFVHERIRFNGEDTSLVDYAEAIADNVKAVPDYHWTIEDFVTDGEVIAVRLTDTGTPKEEWLGIAPTGRSFSISEFTLYGLREGKIAEMRFLLDRPTAARQVQENA